jgi:ABC-type ATPase with predicted acetyltransferase domain
MTPDCYHFTIDKAFKTSVDRTPRVLELAEAFGLGLNDKDFIVYDGLKIDIVQGDVVYINGQSGSGKSLLLRELISIMRSDVMKL